MVKKPKQALAERRKREFKAGDRPLYLHSKSGKVNIRFAAKDPGDGKKPDIKFSVTVKSVDLEKINRKLPHGGRFFLAVEPGKDIEEALEKYISETIDARAKRLEKKFKRRSRVAKGIERAFAMYRMGIRRGGDEDDDSDDSGCWVERL